MRTLQKTSLLIGLYICFSTESGRAQADWGSILAVPDAVKRTAELVGIVESVDKKLDRLLEKDLKTGLKLLEDAQRASDPKGREKLFEDARLAFTNAESIDEGSSKGPRLLKTGIALFGKAHCYLALNDPANARAALVKISEMKTEPSGVDVFVGTFKGEYATAVEEKTGPQWWKHTKVIFGGETALAGALARLAIDSKHRDEAIEKGLGEERAEFLKLQTDVNEYLAKGIKIQYQPKL